jgi:hypothetical protein
LDFGPFGSPETALVPPLGELEFEPELALEEDAVDPEPELDPAFTELDPFAELPLAAEEPEEDAPDDVPDIEPVLSPDDCPPVSLEDPPHPPSIAAAMLTPRKEMRTPRQEMR